MTKLWPCCRLCRRWPYRGVWREPSWFSNVSKVSEGVIYWAHMLTLHLALPVFVLHLCVLYICIDYMTRDAACQARYLMFSFPQVKWTGGDLTECLASDTKPANSIICQNLEAQRLLPLDWYNSCFLTWPGFFWLRHGALEKEAGGGTPMCTVRGPCERGETFIMEMGLLSAYGTVLWYIV